MSDEELIAMVAAQSQGHMNRLLQGSNDRRAMNENRTDWRRFLGSGGQRPPQQRNPNQQHYGHPPPNNHPQQQQFGPMDDDYRNFGDISIPSEVPSNIHQLPLPPLPKDEHGNPIIPAELQQYFQNNQQQPIQQAGLNVGGFEIPQYGNPASSSSSLKMDEKYDNIIKEIKLLKRAVSTLTNLLKKSILVEDVAAPPETPTTDTIKSENSN